MQERVVVERTWERLPIGEMDMNCWFVPAKLWPWWSRSSGVCRRLGQHPNGRVTCEYRPHVLSNVSIRFTMAGTLPREILRVSRCEEDAA